MRFPGILPLVFFLFLVPAITPIIQQFWPTSTTWWPALLVAVLGAASSALWLLNRKRLAKVDMPPGAAADVGGASGWKNDELQRLSWRGWLLG